MPLVRVSRRAQLDFDEILLYLSGVAEAGVAARYARDIQAAINRLEGLPHIGPPRPKLGANIRILIVAPYLVIYDPDTYEDVVVLRILHGHRNITRAMVHPSN